MTSELTDAQIAARVAKIMGLKPGVHEIDPLSTADDPYCRHCLWPQEAWSRNESCPDNPPFDPTAPGADFWRAAEWAVANGYGWKIENYSHNGKRISYAQLWHGPGVWWEYSNPNPRRAFCLALVAAVETTRPEPGKTRYCRYCHMPDDDCECCDEDVTGVTPGASG